MANITTVMIGGRTIVVEVEPGNVPITPVQAAAFGPEGADLVNFGDRLKDATQIIKDTIGGISVVIMQAFREAAPDECEVEIGFAFKGENQPIPILVRVGGEASIKVTAKWKKSGTGD